MQPAPFLVWPDSEGGILARSVADDIMIELIPDKGGASMTGNEIKTDGLRAAADRQSGISPLESRTRPYYWSWYGTVFDSGNAPRRVPTVYPEVGGKGPVS